jgi:uncharacterized membrane protein
LTLTGARVHDDSIAVSVLADHSILRAVATRNLGVNAAFLVGATLAFDFKLAAAVLLFGLLGAGLTFGFGYATQFFHAGSIAFALGAGTGTKHREEVRAT